MLPVTEQQIAKRQLLNKLPQEHFIDYIKDNLCKVKITTKLQFKATK